MYKVIIDFHEKIRGWRNALQGIATVTDNKNRELILSQILYENIPTPIIKSSLHTCLNNAVQNSYIT